MEPGLEERKDGANVVPVERVNHPRDQERTGRLAPGAGRKVGQPVPLPVWSFVAKYLKRPIAAIV
jgi:hypothetical protein